MSHYMLMVVVPPGVDRDAHIERVLAPYDEGRAVEPYDAECSCRGREADCEECHGSGTYISTYNPESKWDWYVVGGRWTGVLGDIDPRRNHANRGRGGRDLGNEISVGAMLALDAETFAKRCGFGVLTPDGEWHERGAMGWFGSVDGDAGDAEWIAQVRRLLEGMPPAHRIVAVDCHI